MNVRRCLGLGLLVIAGGCAVQPPPAADIDHSKPATDHSRWLADSDPSADALAKQTSAYAASMRLPGLAVDPGKLEPKPPQAKFLDRPDRHQSAEEIAPLIPETPAAPVRPVDSVEIKDLVSRPRIPDKDATAPAQLASANIPSDQPKTVPEWADFTTSNPNPTAEPLETRLRKLTRDNPDDIAGQLDLQLYEMLNDQPPVDLAMSMGLPTEDSELLDSLVDGLRNFRSTVRQDRKMLHSDKIKPLLAMADRLRSQAGLSVHGMALCRRVGGFGNYVPIEPPQFPIGSDKNVAIVYCEVENFLPLQNSQGMWETKLSEKVTLYSDLGVPVWSDSARPVIDQCRNRRHDFFATNIITLPPSLPVGRYTLNITVDDQNANSEDEAKTPLWIIAKANGN